MTHTKIPLKDKDENPFYTSALKLALNLLSHRTHTRFELERKLSLRGFSEDIIDSVLSYCERFNYLNDRTAAHGYVESLIRKNVGIYRIEKSMSQRGFSREQIKRSMDEHDLLNLEPDLAKRALEKKAKTLCKTKTEQKTKDALIRFLVSRGFRSATIRSLLETGDL